VQEGVGPLCRETALPSPAAAPNEIEALHDLGDKVLAKLPLYRAQPRLQTTVCRAPPNS
jgi:hypothetical protein